MTTPRKPASGAAGAAAAAGAGAAGAGGRVRTTPRTGPPRKSPATRVPVRRRRSLVRRTLLTLLALGVSLAVFLAAFVTGLLEAPFPSDASSPASGVAYLLDAHGHPYAQIKPAEARSPLASYSDIGQTMVNAIVAAEDERYFSHGGVDPLAILRAAGSDLTGGPTSGASTITQQYVKNVYTNRQRTLLRKVKEAALAVRLDRAKSKQEILRLYLNSVYFGNNNYGVEAAAEFYFRVHTKDLSCGQAAMLAGLVSAPSAHEPVNHFADAKIRQHYVLDREVALKTLTAEQATQCYDSITPASIKGKSTNNNVTTPYPEYTDLVTTQVRSLGPDLLQSGNALVRTPLDEDLQDAAQDALASVLKTPGDPEGVVVGINPKTGDVTTIATQGQPAKDGLSAGYHRFGLDIATSQYPVSGSTIKPFTLATALASGKYTLNSGIYGPHEKSVTSPGCTQPLLAVNAEDGEGGYFSLRTALAQSVNTVYAQLAVDVGLDKVKALATKAGIPTAFDAQKTTDNPTGFHYGFDGAPGTSCPVVPSQSLGVAVSPINLDTAYSTIEDGGTYHPQRFITQVQVGASGPRANDGTVIELPKPAAPVRAMSTTVATEVQTAMRGVVVAGGTAQPQLGQLPYVLTDLIGKTGTTQNENNAWFIGCRPTLCLAVWMGYDLPNNPDGTPHSMNGTEGVGQVYGGTLPAKIFATTYADYQANLKQSGQPPLTASVLSTIAPYDNTLPVPTPSTTPTPTATPSRKPRSSPTPSKSRRASASSSAAAPTTGPPATSAAPAPPTSGPPSAAATATVPVTVTSPPAPATTPPATP